MESKLYTWLTIVFFIFIIALFVLPFFPITKDIPEKFSYTTAIVVNLVCGIFTASLLAFLIEQIIIRNKVHDRIIEFTIWVKRIEKFVGEAYSLVSIDSLFSNIRAFHYWRADISFEACLPQNQKSHGMRAAINAICDLINEIRALCVDIMSIEQDLRVCQVEELQNAHRIINLFVTETKIETIKENAHKYTTDSFNRFSLLEQEKKNQYNKTLDYVKKLNEAIENLSSTINEYKIPFIIRSHGNLSSK